MSSADTPFSGIRNRTGPSQALSFSPIHFADRAAFLGRRAHQRDVGIVLVEQPAAILLRHGLRRPEIDHVERADRADIGHLRAGDRVETVLGRRQHAAEQEVADFGRGDVDARRPAGRCRRASPSSGRRCRWRGTPGSRSPSRSVSAIAVTQGVVTPNMVRPERRLAVGRRGGRLRHGDDRLRGVVKDDAADPVQPGHVGDRRHHDDVGDADIGRHVARGERRDHDLGQAERQLAHAGGDDRGAAAAADADDAGNVVACRRRSARRPRPWRRRPRRGRRKPAPRRCRRADARRLRRRKYPA